MECGAARRGGDAASEAMGGGVNADNGSPETMTGGPTGREGNANTVKGSGIRLSTHMIGVMEQRGVWVGQVERAHRVGRAAQGREHQRRQHKGV